MGEGGRGTGTRISEKIEIRTCKRECNKSVLPFFFCFFFLYFFLFCLGSGGGDGGVAGVRGGTGYVNLEFI